MASDYTMSNPCLDRRETLQGAQFEMGDRFLSSAGAGGNCARPTRLPDPSPVLDKSAPMGPEILSSTGAGVWRRAAMAFPDSSSVLDKFQSAMRWSNFFTNVN